MKTLLKSILIAGALFGYAVVTHAASPPVAFTRPATLVTGTSAQFNTLVNPNGAPTTNRFEWGAASTALAFDGVDDYFSVPGGVNLTNSSFTLEAWARHDASSGYDTILSQGPWATRLGLFLGFTDTKAFAFGFTGDDLGTPVAYPDSDWHHWAGTYNASNGERKIYRDGIMVAEDTARGAYAGTGTVLVGTGPSGLAGSAFNGNIDEVRIWTVVRTPEELRTNLYSRLIGTEPNLVAYYRLDEGAGTTTADATRHGLTGALVNNPTWSPGTRPVFDQVTSWQSVSGTNSVLNLDGVDDYVDVPDGFSFNNEFTIETWVYERNYNNWSRVIDFGNGGPSDNVVLSVSQLATGKPNLEVYRGASGQGITAPDPIPLNQWVHLAATLKNNIGTIYVNGVAVVSGQVTAPNAVTRTKNYIGLDNWGGSTHANTLYDDLRIWNVARTPAQIRQFMTESVSPEDTNLLLNYRFDELSGLTVVDSRSTSPQNGTLTNGAARLSSIPVSTTLPNLLPGTAYCFRSVAQNTNGTTVGSTERFATLAPGGGTALWFDGANDHAMIADHPALHVTNSFTVECWTKTPSTLSGHQTLVSKVDEDSNQRGWEIYLYGTRLWVFFDRYGTYSDYKWMDTGLDFNPSTWYNLVVTHDSSLPSNNIKVYTNGILSAQATWAKPVYATAANLLIGGYEGVGNGLNGGADRYWYRGQMDEFRIWNVGRTESQILAEWNTRLTGTESNLVAYYRMDEGAGPVLRDATTNALDGLLVNGPLWVPSTAPVGRPLVRTEDATDVTLNGATLHGRVTPGGSGDVFWFEWGADLTFGHTNAPQWISGTNSVLSLDGADDYVDVPDGLWFAYDFTVEAEVFLRDYDWATRVFDFGNGSPLDNVLLMLGTGGLEYEVYRGTSMQELRSPVRLPTNQWCHVAVTHQGNTATLFLNGVVVASGSVWRPDYVPNRTNNFIGHSNWSGDPYANAMFDNVRIWNTALAPDTLRAWIGVPVTDLHPQWSALAAEWRFDEADGVAAIDTSGQNRDGTLKGGASRLTSVPVSAPVSGFDRGTVYYFRCVAQNADGLTVGEPQRLVTLVPGAGTALSFDGVDDYVSVSDNETLHVSSNFTVECWIKTPTNFPSDATYVNVVSKWDDDSNQRGWMLIFGAPYAANHLGVLFDTYGNWADHMVWDTGVVFNTNTWYHMAVTHDGTLPSNNVKVYINGTLGAQNNWAKPVYANLANLLIGGYEGPGNGLNGGANSRWLTGQIDEVRIWNVARPQADIQRTLFTPLAGNEPGLAAYYRLDDGAGRVVRDATPYRNHGLLVNGPLWVPSTMPFYAVTIPATAITRTSATLSGLVSLNVAPTTAWFEWGTDSTYGQSTAQINLGSGSNSVPATATLTTLVGGWLYHYRLVSSNSFGVYYGQDMLLSTIGIRDVNFGLGLQYGTNALRPAVAINSSNVVVEIHATNAPPWRLSYRVGQPNKATVNWGTNVFYAAGENPSVALNSNVVVEMHKGTTSLEYNVGRVSGSSIIWGSISNCGPGDFPAIAINDQGVVVEVHTSGSSLSYRVGAVSGTNLNWLSNPTNYDTGELPSIALNNQNQVVAAHESAGKLYYRVGRVTGSTIAWTNSWYYDDGKRPSVAVTDDRYVIEVHTSANQKDLTWRVGWINNDRLDWLGTSERFDAGAAPSVACNGQLAIRVNEMTDGVGLAFSTSLLTDRSSWMQDRLYALYDTPLNRLVLPDSHDAAMYRLSAVYVNNTELEEFASGFDYFGWFGLRNLVTQIAQNLAVTQDQSVYDQLRMGIRAFDLRPKKRHGNGSLVMHHSQNLDYNISIDLGFLGTLELGIFSFSSEGASVDEVLEDVRRFMVEGHRELVVLKFGTYWEFDNAAYLAMVTKIQDYLGPWLINSLPPGKQRLSEATLGELLAYHGAVLVRCSTDGGYFTNNPSPGIWDPGQYFPQGSFADTDDYLTMLNKDFTDFTNYTNELFGLAWQLTVQGDYLNAAVSKLAPIANPNLGATLAEWPEQNTNGRMVNQISVDFGEQSRVTDVALFQLGLPGTGPEPPVGPTNALTGFESWAQAWGLGTNSQTLDADLDGISNFNEYLAGSNPTNSNSKFLLRIAMTQATPQVSFDALRASGIGYDGLSRHYALEWTTNLQSANWQGVPGYSDIVGSNQTVVYNPPGSSGPRYFRGRVGLATQSAAPEEFRLLAGLAAGQMAISFTALGPDALGRNRYYTLERATNITSGAWVAVPGCSNVLGAGQTLTNFVPLTGTSPGFYRGRLDLRNP